MIRTAWKNATRSGFSIAGSLSCIIFALISSYELLFRDDIYRLVEFFFLFLVTNAICMIGQLLIERLPNKQ